MERGTPTDNNRKTFFGVEKCKKEIQCKKTANFGEIPAKFRQNFVKIQQNSVNFCKISEKLAIFGKILANF